MRRIDLVAVQPYVDVSDYVTEERFATRLRGLFDAVAEARQGVDWPALVVFPEMFGAFLPLMGHEDSIEGCQTTDEAMTRIATRKLGGLARTMLKYRTLSTNRAFFALMAPQMHQVFFGHFSRLSRDYGYWVVAGSLLTPVNRYGVDTLAFEPQSAEFYNTSYCFDPGGHCRMVARKVNLVPTQEDTLGLSPGRPQDQKIWSTPFGKVGVTICYDGFREPHTSNEPEFVPLGLYLDAQGADILTCPSANPWPWNESWVFNDSGESLLRREQWFCEGLASTLAQCKNVRYGINPMLIGRILDHPFDGPSTILERKPDGVHELARATRTDIHPSSQQVLRVTVDLPV